MRIFRYIGLASWSALTLAMPPPTRAQTLPLAVQFRSVELHGGGQVFLRHGDEQGVTLLEGSSRYTRVAVQGGRLIIDNCPAVCPRGYRLKLAIVTPEIERIAVAHGGTIQTAGAFPRQAALAAVINEGGTIDIRSMAAASVAASVNQGGRIFARPGTALTASVNQGGKITYWGDPAVRRTIRDGGIVAKGASADAGRPLSELSPPLPSVPNLPPLPPIGRPR